MVISRLVSGLIAMIQIVTWIWEIFMDIDNSKVEVVLGLPKGQCVVKVYPAKSVMFCLLNVWLVLWISF